LKAAEKAFEDTRFEKAARLLRGAIELEPGNPEAHYALGMSLAMQNKTAEAMEAFRRTVECDPKYADAWYALGNGFEEQGMLEEAQAHFQRAVEIEPGDEETKERLAGVQRRLGL